MNLEQVIPVAFTLYFTIYCYDNAMNYIIQTATKDRDQKICYFYEFMIKMTFKQFYCSLSVTCMKTKNRLYSYVRLKCHHCKC